MCAGRWGTHQAASRVYLWFFGSYDKGFPADIVSFREGVQREYYERCLKRSAANAALYEALTYLKVRKICFSPSTSEVRNTSVLHACAATTADIVMLSSRHCSTHHRCRLLGSRSFHCWCQYLSRVLKSCWGPFLFRVKRVIVQYLNFHLRFLQRVKVRKFIRRGRRTCRAASANVHTYVLFLPENGST